MTMKSTFFSGCILGLLASTAVLAANPWEPGGSLDACIEAVVKEHPGIVTGWQQSGGGDAPPYVISILDKEGKNAEAFCDPAKPSSFTFTGKMGLYRYSMYERAVVPEVKARATAPEIFAGPVRLTVMDLSVGVSGKPTYKYQMFLPGGHKATVEIDAVTGRLNKGQVN